MSSTLRAVAVASCSALLLAGVATSAGAADGASTVRVATAATGTISKPAVTFPHAVTVTGSETIVSTGKPVVGQQAILQRRATNGAWHHVSGVSIKTTGVRGAVHWEFTPRADAKYRVFFRQSPAYGRVTTAAQAVTVTPKIVLTKLHTVSQYSTSAIKGSVHPHLPGTAQLQVYKHGAWQAKATAAISGGRFSFPLSPSKLGTKKYRVIRSGDAVHSDAVSHALTVHIVHRTLTLGATGKDVLTLQKRLAKLHYDVGPRNGTYGYDTLHAVTAFQKVNGLEKDGETGKQVWSKLNHPTSVHLKHPYPQDNLDVEVNLAKQIVILAKHGKVWRILDSSTAGGYLYTGSDGQVERAVTPTGHFHIQYKITGWHKSSLGELYYPSYFTDTGYAIHGEGNGNDAGEVPPYANSHGCVRITNDAVLRYYNQLVVGTSVWIYN